MLRLPPTQIKLQERDYKWHKPRYEIRQELRANLTPANITNTLRNSPNKYNDARTGRRISRSVLEQAASKLAISSGYRSYQPDTSIYSREPVPTGSRAFWDRVLAEAGTPTRTKTTSLGNARVVDPSDDFLDSVHSSRVSIERATIEGHKDNGDTYFDDQGNHTRTLRFFPSGEEQKPLQQTPDSSEDSQAAVSDREFLPPSRQSTQTTLSKPRLSWLPFHRKPRATNANGNTDGDRRPSGSVAMDGPSDPQHNRSTRLSQGFDTEMEDVDDRSYEGRRERLTSSSNLDMVAVDAIDHDSTSIPRSLHERPSLPTISGRQSPRRSRLPSYGRIRSPLHISQAATSSSPDVLQTSRGGDVHEPRFNQRQGLLAFRPRRPRRYRPRSETYSYEESQDFDGSVPAQSDGQNSAQTTTAAVPSLTVTHPRLRSAPSNPAYHSIRVVTPEDSRERLNSSPLEEPINAPYWSSPRQIHSNYSTPSPRDGVQTAIHQSMSSIGTHDGRPSSVHSHPSSRHTSTRSNHPVSSSRNLSPFGYGHSNTSSPYLSQSPRNLSPFAPEFIPATARRTATPHFALPPPFSATPRNVSSNQAIPSSSPLSPQTPPQRRTDQRIPSIAEIPSPTSPLRIPVYDDRRSPTNQPQTPAGLRRNGLPVMETQNPFGPRNPPATAPARQRGGFASAAGERAGGAAMVADWQAFATPTRRPLDRRSRPFDVFDAERENEGRMTEMERALRREAMLQQPLRMGREEAERMERGLTGSESPRAQGSGG